MKSCGAASSAGDPGLIGSAVALPEAGVTLWPAAPLAQRKRTDSPELMVIEAGENELLATVNVVPPAGGLLLSSEHAESAAAPATMASPAMRGVTRDMEASQEEK